MDALFTTLSSVFWLAIVLGIVVTIHELGHFLAARFFGMRVDVFSVGVGKSLYKRQIGPTEYRIGALPLGGYVKIVGMVDESLDTEGLESDPEPDEFRAKPVWQRMIVISAGVIFNVILAFVVYTGLAFAYPRIFTPAENVRLDVVEGSTAYEMGLRSGDSIVGVGGKPVEGFEDVFDPTVFSASPLLLNVRRGEETVDLRAPDDLVTRLSRAQREAEEAGEDPTLRNVFGVQARHPAILSDVTPGYPAEEAGLETGDRITAVDGQPVRTWTEFTALVTASNGEPLQVTWEPATGGEPTTATITPRESNGRYLIGAVLDEFTLGVQRESLGVGEALASGFERTVATTSTYFGFVGKLVTGRESVRESMGGPLVIARESARAAERGAQSFWSFLAFLSIALAVFNILPIPVLDGGHLVFLAYEGLFRREAPLKFRIAVQQVGMVLILALMAFVIFNDAVRLFG